MADETNPEGIGEDGLTDEQRAIKDEAKAGVAAVVQAAKKRDVRGNIQKANEEAKAAIQTAADLSVLPKGFDGTTPPKGFKIKISPEDWQIIHGKTPNEIWLKRSRDFVPSDKVTFELPACRHCGSCARRHGKLAVSCLGCGIVAGGEEE